MKVLSGLAFVLATSLLISSAVGFTAKTNTPGATLNVRAQPNTKSAVVGSIPNGAQFQVGSVKTGDNIRGQSGTSNVWYHVPSKNGYISAAFATVFANVNAQGNTLNVRASATTGSRIVGSLAANAQIEVECQVNGDNIKGDSGTSNVWYYVPLRGGYVSAAFVKNIQSAPSCQGKPTPTPPAPGRDCSAGLKNPRTCAQAVAWAEAHLTNTYNSRYHGKCDHFVGLAYGRSYSGFYSALVHWQSTPAKYKFYDRNPPPGALCFFDTSKYGHATLSTGGGNLISTDINGPGTLGRTSISHIEAKWGARYYGWTNPYFHNE